MKLEKLNLYTKKIQKISIQKFLIYLIIALIPFVSIMFYTYVWTQWKINEIAVKYPKVLNLIDLNDFRNAPNIINNEITNFNGKIQTITKKIDQYHEYFNKVLISKYFLQVLFDEFNKLKSKNSDLEYFVDYIEINSDKYFVRFYEFSESSKVNVEEILKRLKIIYKDPNLYLNSTKNLYGNFKMFEYILEGSLWN